MTAQLNHTIVWCRDNLKSSTFLASILRLPPPKPVFHFMVVELGNGVAMDFMAKEGEVAPQHYAFLVSDDEFDFGLERVRETGQVYWADPGRTRPGKIYEHGGGRGFYFQDPDGHLLELLTKAEGI